MSAARNLAAELVRRYNLAPPVDIFDLAQQVADVEVIEWDFDCDGLAVGLATSRPKIFLRDNVSRLRQRFTLAHEFGHVRMMWHVESVQCHIDSAGNSGEFLGFNQEVEANSFASHLLIPDRFLEPFVAAYGPADEMLKALELADVSALAGVIALSRQLLPGYVFELPDGQRVVSTGTGPLQHETARVLRASAVDTGRTWLQGQQITWYQLVSSSAHVPSDTDGRSTLDILRSMARDVRPGVDETVTIRQMAGKVGGCLSKRKDVTDEKTLHAMLVHFFDDDGATSDLSEHADFDIYLRRRAKEVAAKRSAS